MIRLLRSVAIGVAAAAVLLTLLHLDTPPWLLGVSLAVAILTGVLASIVGSFGGSAGVGVQDVEAADREQRITLAKVLDTRATGSSINDQPICELRLIVAPRTRAPYETTARALINLGRLPSMQAGAVVVVAQVEADRPEVALLDPAPDHWQQQAAQDTRVRALTSAPVWEVPPKPGRDKRGFLRIPGVVLVLVAVLAFAGTLRPHRESLVDLATGTSLDEVRAQADRRADEAASIYPADRTPGVVDDMVALAGTTQVTGVHVFQTYAYLDALTSADATTTDEYTWRDGTAAHDGATSIQPDPADLPRMLFDVTTIDWTLVETLTDQIADLTGIDDPAPMVAVSRPITGISQDDGVWTYGDVQFVVSVSDEYHDGSITYDTAGQVVSMSGGAPGSTTADWVAANG